MSKNKCESYVWAYFTKNINNAMSKCKICGKVCLLKKDYYNIKSHITEKHKDSVPKRKEEWPFSIIQQNITKCGICDKMYDIMFTTSAWMGKHLESIHNINKKNQDWMSHYKYTISNETMQCKYCKIIFQNDVKHKYFNAMKHLIDAHQIAGISLEFRSTE